MPACLAAADIGVAPFDVAAHGPLALGFYWSPLKIFEYMAAGPAGRRAGAAADRGARRARPRGRCSTIRPDPAALADALDALTDPALRRAARARGRATRRARLQLGGALPRRSTRRCAGRARHRPHERSCIVTDAFPPVCGGSGWSTYELARGLRARGHDVLDRAAAARHAGDDARAPTTGSASSSSAPRRRRCPYVRNYFKNERLHARLADYLADAHPRASSIDIVHGAARADVPAVDRGGARRAACRSSAPCATTGRCATGRI